MLTQASRAGIGLLAAMLLMATLPARADVVTDANAKAAEIASRHPATPIAVRIMAAVQVSVFEATNTITGRYPPYRTKLAAAPGASVDAAVAAATRTTLLKLLPSQQAAIEADYQAALKSVADGPAKSNGITVGEQAATAILAMCAEDGAMAPNTYKPHAAPGVYVPTVFPAVPHWGKRKPWVMTGGNQFRPGPPPALTSDAWKRDLAEIKTIGGKSSTVRTPEQTAIAQFWEATLPVVYGRGAPWVTRAPGRDVTDNARVLAQAAMAMDDALIAVFDAKYTYNLWRPVTALRNTEGDAGDPGWLPFIDTPMHPEYPCAHCIVSGSLAAVLAAEIGAGAKPRLSSTSHTAQGAARSWATTDEFAQEVAVARIYDGVHYRYSTVVGTQMGKQVGELVVKSFPKPVK